MFRLKNFGQTVKDHPIVTEVVKHRNGNTCAGRIVVTIPKDNLKRYPGFELFAMLPNIPAQVLHDVPGTPAPTTTPTLGRVDSKFPIVSTLADRTFDDIMCDPVLNRLVTTRHGADALGIVKQSYVGSFVALAVE